GGLVDAQHGQRLGLGRIHHGAADADLFDAVDQHDVAGLGLVHQFALQALELQHLVDPALAGRAVGTALVRHFHAGTHAAAIDAADAYRGHVAVIVQRHDLPLQRGVGIGVALRHV